MTFGQKSFVTWTTGLMERIEKIPDKEYICLSCNETYADGWMFSCPKCQERICPKCGGEIATIKEYDEAMKDNE